MIEKLEDAKIGEAVVTIWKTVLGLDVTPNSAARTNRPRPNNMTGSIHISGAWQGALKFECPEGMVRRIASIMFAMNVRDLTRDEVDDALAELTNILGGSIKSLVTEPSFLSMPTVTEGTDYFFSIPGTRPMTELSFICEEYPFQVTVLALK